MSNKTNFWQTGGRTETQNILFYLIWQPFTHFHYVAFSLIFIALTDQNYYVRKGKSKLVSE